MRSVRRQKRTICQRPRPVWPLCAAYALRGGDLPVARYAVWDLSVVDSYFYTFSIDTFDIHHRQICRSIWAVFLSITSACDSLLFLIPCPPMSFTSFPSGSVTLVQWRVVQTNLGSRGLGCIDGMWVWFAQRTTLAMSIALHCCSRHFWGSRLLCLKPCSSFPSGRVSRILVSEVLLSAIVTNLRSRGLGRIDSSTFWLTQLTNLAMMIALAGVLWSLQRLDALVFEADLLRMSFVYICCDLMSWTLTTMFDWWA